MELADGLNFTMLLIFLGTVLVTTWRTLSFPSDAVPSRTVRRALRRGEVGHDRASAAHLANEAERFLRICHAQLSKPFRTAVGIYAVLGLGELCLALWTDDAVFLWWAAIFLLNVVTHLVGGAYYSRLARRLTETRERNLRRLALP